MAETDFDLETFLPYMLNQAAEVSSLAFQKIYKERYGLLRTEWRVLFHLGLYGQLTASEIGARARMHKTKISRAVQRLAERRFVTRKRDAGDRRVEHLTLTVQGRAAYHELRAVAERYERDLLAQLEPDEVAALRRALGKLTSAAPDGFT
ncbi:MarR family winged helix-turn-helix transcriptional regulator [Marimonas sp. MJW-29]|uniref:MarR family winged helix-turn-helix transcriptional regulator n=1 Tax=Sulfitobacter sediminis TaxID=3234186 RepID=A0ABV3RII9_9RHOB